LTGRLRAAAHGVTVMWAATLATPPTVTTTGCTPAATLFGITKFTWVTPARPGGMPTKLMGAVIAPTVTDKGKRGWGSRPSGVARKGEAPVASDGETWPSPVRKSVGVSPGFPSPSGNTAPVESVKIPGAEGATVKISDATRPLLFTPRTAGPAPVSYGIWIFNWVGET